MAVRNILDRLTGGGTTDPDTIVDQYFYSTSIDWTGPFSTSSTITFAKTNNLCVITCPIVSATSVIFSSEITGSVEIPPEMKPQNGSFRSTLNLVVNNQLKVPGLVYIGADNRIHVSASAVRGTPFTPGSFMGGAAYGIIMVYLI